MDLSFLPPEVYVCACWCLLVVPSWFGGGSSLLHSMLVFRGTLVDVDVLLEQELESADRCQFEARSCQKNNGVVHK